MSQKAEVRTKLMVKLRDRAQPTTMNIHLPPPCVNNAGPLLRSRLISAEMQFLEIIMLLVYPPSHGTQTYQRASQKKSLEAQEVRSMCVGRGGCGGGVPLSVLG